MTSVFFRVLCYWFLLVLLVQQVATSLAVLSNFAEIVVTQLFSTYRNLILPETGFRFLFLTVTRLRNHNTTGDHGNVDL